MKYLIIVAFLSFIGCKGVNPAHIHNASSDDIGTFTIKDTFVFAGQSRIIFADPYRLDTTYADTMFFGHFAEDSIIFYFKYDYLFFSDEEHPFYLTNTSQAFKINDSKIYTYEKSYTKESKVWQYQKITFSLNGSYLDSLNFYTNCFISKEAYKGSFSGKHISSDSYFNIKK